MAVQQAKVDQMRAMAELKQKQLDALKVRAGIDGVLVDMPLHVGEHVLPGTMLAKVVQPNHLMAELKIAETQARDIQIGEPASVDTHNGMIEGTVMRVDPAVQNGTVTVDVQLTGELPKGARPDLSVDGTIDLEKLDNVLYVGRPAFGKENSTISLFRLDPDGQDAARVPVKVGRASVNAIQVHSGLHEGDTVILSDMSRWDNTDRIRLEYEHHKSLEIEADTCRTMANHLIQIEDMTKVFYTDEIETHALSGVHLTINRGEYVAMSGPSGCGKSTLLSIIGLLDTPTGGKYLAERQAGGEPRFRGALAHSQPGDRLHLPELQSDWRSHGV